MLIIKTSLIRSISVTIMKADLSSFFHRELFRYIVNGVFATAVHFFVLTFNLNVLNFNSAGFANLIAACFGIFASFMGSRYFVFRKTGEYIIRQASKFLALYIGIAILHGVVLWIWTDIYALDYRGGFLIATILQVMLSYLGNKYLVFSV